MYVETLHGTEAGLGAIRTPRSLPPGSWDQYIDTAGTAGLWEFMFFTRADDMFVTVRVGVSIEGDTLMELGTVEADASSKYDTTSLPPG